jgi:hypothetical protein
MGDSLCVDKYVAFQVLHFASHLGFSTSLLDQTDTDDNKLEAEYLVMGISSGKPGVHTWSANVGAR